MWDTIYQWCIHHQTLCGIIATLFSFVIGWVIPNDKLVKAGFFFSQFIRRAFGARLEQKIEEAMDAFDKGMKGDNK